MATRVNLTGEYQIGIRALAGLVMRRWETERENAQMTHWTGMQSGWNTKGGTPKEHAAIEREVNNSWRIKAENECQLVADVLGDDYGTWAEMTWPGTSIDRKSYQEIHETAQHALEEIAQGVDLLACTCSPNGDACPVCQAHARLHSYDPSIA